MVLIIVIIMLLGAYWVIRAVQHSGSSHSAVAVVGDDTISDDQWTAELKKRYGQEILLQMMNRRVVAKEAQALHIGVSEQEIDDNLQERMSGYSSPDTFYKEMSTQFGLSRQDLREESKYQIELEKIATVHIEVSDEQVNQYMKQNAQKSDEKRQYELAWIKTDDADSASEAVQRLQKGDTFADIAKALSTDKFSADKGGKLGWIDNDDPFQPPEVMRAIQSMQPGDIVGPIMLASGGYAVVQVLDIRQPQSAHLEISADTARRKIALEQAKPLIEIEQELRKKYGAYILSVKP